MNSNEIYKKYLNVLSERLDLENNITNLIERWKNGKTIISSDEVQKVVDKGYEKVEKLKELENQLHAEYINKDKEELAKKMADISVWHNLGVMPSAIEISDGVLSSNASESHLNGYSKTKEQLESEREKLLRDIKSKVTNHEISLAQASKLTKDVNTSYDYFNTSEDLEDLTDNNKIHK